MGMGHPVIPHRMQLLTAQQSGLLTAGVGEQHARSTGPYCSHQDRYPDDVAIHSPLKGSTPSTQSCYGSSQWGVDAAC